MGRMSSARLSFSLCARRSSRLRDIVPSSPRSPWKSLSPPSISSTSEENESSSSSSWNTCLNSIVRVHTNTSTPSFLVPWNSKSMLPSLGGNDGGGGGSGGGDGEGSATRDPICGTGFYVGNGRFLTNAHVVADHTYVTVKSGYRTNPVEVIASGHECDLALLRVKPTTQEEEHARERENGLVLEKMKPLRFGGLPVCIDVFAWGYIHVKRFCVLCR